MDDLELHEAQHDELWLVSYADLLTLLLGFFVLIVASVPLKNSRFEQIAAAMSPNSRAAPLEQLQERLQEVIDRTPGLRDQVQIHADGEGLAVELKDALLFDSGSAEIRREGKEAIDKLVLALKALPDRPISIDGHTDDVPVRGGIYASNWELSAARGIHVLRALEGAGIPRERMSVRAFADTRMPPSDGPLETRRLANRRVVLRVE